MRVYLASAVAVLFLATASMFVLDRAVQRNADQMFMSPSSVRLSDHGNTHNLVGRDWYSARSHGWETEIPTGNSPTANPPEALAKK